MTHCAPFWNTQQLSISGVGTLEQLNTSTDKRSSDAAKGGRPAGSNAAVIGEVAHERISHAI